MTITECPECSQQVLLPVPREPNVTVRCPHCLAEYELGSILDSLPPQLEFVESESPTPEPPSPAPFGIDDDPLTLAPEEETKAPSFDFSPAPSESDESNSTTATAAIQRPQRPQRPRSKRRPIVELAKVVAGALVAVPLAQLVLWWLPNWRRDPLALAPKLPAAIAFLAPIEFRGESFSDGPADDLPNPFDLNEDTTFGFGDSSSFLDTDFDTDLDDEKVTSSRTNDANKDQPDSGSSSTEINGHKASKPTLSFTSADLVDRLQEANGAKQILARVFDSQENLSKEERLNLAAEFYSAQRRLAETVTNLEGEPEAVRPLLKQIDQLCLDFAAKPGQLGLLANLASQVLDSPDPDHPGIVIAGDVISVVTNSDGTFLTDIRLLQKQQRHVTVVSNADPKTVYNTTDRVVVFGVTIADARHHSSTDVTTQSATTPIVIGGYPVRIPQ